MREVSSLDPENPDLYLAAALERVIVRHEAGQFEELGSEYDQIEMEPLPFRDRASEAYVFAFRFWDGWVDASNHEWHHYEPLGRDAWPLLAREVIAALRKGTCPDNPVLMRFFGPQPPSVLRRLWNHVRSVPTEPSA
jgi:hypothetical protein